MLNKLDRWDFLEIPDLTDKLKNTYCGTSLQTKSIMNIFWKKRKSLDLLQNLSRWGDIFIIYRPADKYCGDNTYDCSWKTKKFVPFKSDNQLANYHIIHLKTFNVSCKLFNRHNICSIITVSVIILTIWSGGKLIINALDNWNARITYVLLIAGVLQAFI